MSRRAASAAGRAAVLVVGLAGAVGLPAAAMGGAGPQIRLPPANGQFDYQIGGAYAPVGSVDIVDRDHTSNPAVGVYNICYINAFQSQAEAAMWWRTHHPALLLHDARGRLVEDPGWPGEYVLNTATKHSRAGLATIEDGWLDGCATKGFDAIEPDNLDSNTRSHHLLTRADNFAFAKLLIAHSHADGLAMAQKNSAEQSARGRALGFDFAIAEECQVYSECRRYTTAYGEEVYEVEYTDNGPDGGHHYFDRACAARGDRISVILRDRDVTAKGSKHYHYEAC